jgi:hypothetical protein
MGQYTITQRRQIIKQFRLALEAGRKKYPIGLPEDMLPFTVTEIKDAIRQQVQDLKTNDKLSDETLQDLRQLYVSLGLFVSSAGVSKYCADRRVFKQSGQKPEVPIYY